MPGCTQDYTQNTQNGWHVVQALAIASVSKMKIRAKNTIEDLTLNSDPSQK